MPSRMSDFRVRIGADGTDGRRLPVRSPRSAIRNGFTLTEVMFAVVLLGIGFILVAAMFPVAIQQSRTSTEETVASGLARAAINVLEQVADDSTMPPTLGEVWLRHPTTPPASGDLWDHIAGSIVNAADPRFAWTALYRRNSQDDRAAQVFIFTLQSRNRPQFDALNDTTAPRLDGGGDKPFPASLEPKMLLVNVVQGNPDRIQLNAAPDTPLRRAVNPRAAAASGAHVIIASGAYSGTVLRLGNPENVANGVWEVAPGTDLPGTVDLVDAPAFIIGRGYSEASTQTAIIQPPEFEGPAMDIMMLTGFVRVK